MSSGASGTYALNGTDFLIPPTTGRWRERTPLDFSGDGHPTYPAIREFEIRWNLIDQASVNQAHTWFEQTISGTVSLDLPAYNSSSYVFQTYSGCILYEPGRGSYFSEHTTEFVLIAGSIRT